MSQNQNPATPPDPSDRGRLIADALLGAPAADRDARLAELRRDDPTLAGWVQTHLDVVRFHAEQDRRNGDVPGTDALRAEARQYIERVRGMPAARRIAEYETLLLTRPDLHAMVRVVADERAVAARRETDWVQADEAARSRAWHQATRIASGPRAGRPAQLDELALHDPALARRVTALLARFDQDPNALAISRRAETEAAVDRPAAEAEAQFVRTRDRESRFHAAVMGQFGRPNANNDFFPEETIRAVIDAGSYTVEPAVPVPDQPPRCPVLDRVVDTFTAVVLERLAQRVRVGDWVSAVTHSRQFEKIPGPKTKGVFMHPGRPQTHVGTVLAVAYAAGSDGLMREAVTVDFGAGEFIAERLAPGANDPDILLPCAAPGCAQPHLNNHPFCRTHRNERPTEAGIAQVELRRRQLQAAADRQAVAQVKDALQRDADVLRQYAVDRQALLVRQRAEELRRQQQAVAQRQADAERAVEAEVRLLRELMAKHGVRGPLPGDPPAGPVPGERNLEL